MAWWFRRHPISMDAAKALNAAAQSQAKAAEDRTLQGERLNVSRSVESELRAHNEANHYDEWLERTIRRGAA